MSKVLFFSCVIGLLFVDRCSCWFINDINSDMLPESAWVNSVLYDAEEFDMDPKASGPRKLNIIFPGTKWCGSGNKAQSDDDLGIHKEADICCREHDKCKYVILGGETKYNLTNDACYSRLSCDCDVDFLNCLRAANTRVAKYIGFIYFDALHTKCFKKEYPITKCNKKGGLLNTKCLEYSYDKTGKPINQWFDVPYF